MSEEARKKISDKAKARPPRVQSDEEKARRAIAMRGNQRALGYRHPPEIRERIAAAKRGKHHSPETRSAIVAGRKLQREKQKPKLRINLLTGAN